MNVEQLALEPAQTRDADTTARGVSCFSTMLVPGGDEIIDIWFDDAWQRVQKHMHMSIVSLSTPTIPIQCNGEKVIFTEIMPKHFINSHIKKQRKNDFRHGSTNITLLVRTCLKVSPRSKGKGQNYKTLTRCFRRKPRYLAQKQCQNSNV